MLVNMVGAFSRNYPFGTEIAFSKGMKRLGHTVNEIDPDYPHQWVQDADATVVFKWLDPSLHGQLAACKGAKIVYQPDDARFPHIREMMATMRRYTDLFLSFDDNSAGIARTMGYRAAETLLLTADDELYCPAPEPIRRNIDVAFIGSLTGGPSHASRRRMCEIVQREAESHRWIISLGSTEHMPTILDTYRRAKVVLNHATDVGQRFGLGFGLQCRHFEVGMTRTALMSNALPGDVPGSIGSDLPFYRFSDEASLVSGLEWMLGENRWEGYGSALYDTIVERHLPQHRAVQLVDFIARNS